jgi:Uma2 family endonuclease
MGIPKIDTGPMTVEEFYVFTDFRPDEEKWELIDGKADVMILPNKPARDDRLKRDTREATVIFEIMSPSTADRDLKWKRAAYTGMSALTHYVVIAQDAVDVVVVSRDRGFAEQRLNSLESALDLGSLGVSLPLSEIYRDTGSS